MLRTEAEAKETTCPQTFGVQEIRGPDYNGIREPGPWSCIGSKCMAWRWRMEPIYGDAGSHRGWRQTEKGFCGLAGMPTA